MHQYIFNNTGLSNTLKHGKIIITNDTGFCSYLIKKENAVNGLCGVCMVGRRK